MGTILPEPEWKKLRDETEAKAKKGYFADIGIGNIVIGILVAPIIIILAFGAWVWMEVSEWRKRCRS